MDNNLKLEIANYIGKLKSHYSQSGLSEQDLQKDLDEINNMALSATLAELLQSKPPTAKLQDEEQLQNYIKNNFTNEEVASALIKSTDEVFKDYIKSIGLDIQL